MWTKPKFLFKNRTTPCGFAAPLRCSRASPRRSLNCHGIHAFNCRVTRFSLQREIAMFAVLAQVIPLRFHCPFPPSLPTPHPLLLPQFQKLTMGEGGYIGYDAWYPIAPGHALGRYVRSLLRPLLFCAFARLGFHSSLLPPSPNSGYCDNDR